MDGSNQFIKSTLLIAIQEYKDRFKGFILTNENVQEAPIAKEIEVYEVTHLKEVIKFFTNPDMFKPPKLRCKKKLLKVAVKKLALSESDYDRILKVTFTVADFE